MSDPRGGPRDTDVSISFGDLSIVNRDLREGTTEISRARADEQVEKRVGAEHESAIWCAKVPTIRTRKDEFRSKLRKEEIGRAKLRKGEGTDRRREGERANGVDRARISRAGEVWEPTIGSRKNRDMNLIRRG